MSKKYIFLYSIVSIISVSVGITFFAPIESIFKGIASIPAACALLAALFQLVRDDAAHSRNKEILHQQQMHSLGSASHMANKVFDKQVDFAEKSSRGVIKAFNDLRTPGEHDKAYDHATDLTFIRLDYMCWLTDSIDEGLHAFKQELRNWGSNSIYIKTPKGQGTDQEHRDQAAREMLEIQAAFLSLFQANERHPEATINSLTKKLRSMLNVEQIVEIKDAIISKSVNGGKDD